MGGIEILSDSQNPELTTSPPPLINLTAEQRLRPNVKCLDTGHPPTLLICDDLTCIT